MTSPAPDSAKLNSPSRAQLDEYLAVNLLNWNERVAGHTAPDGYDQEGLITNPDQLTGVVAFDRQVLGDVTGRSLLHSQCHIGTDTMSWAKLGAQVTGIDFAPAAVAAARELAARMDIDATFVRTELYSAPENLKGEFDIVYTSVGAICWLHDIDGWAKVMGHFTKPGGTFYIRDSHPMLMALDDERDDDQLVVKYPYFCPPTPLSFDHDTSYQGSAIVENSTAYEWAHSVSSVINALIAAGFRIDRVEEHQHLDWQFFDHMEETGEVYVLPEHQRGLVPTQFSILATKVA